MIYGYRFEYEENFGTYQLSEVLGAQELGEVPDENDPEVDEDDVRDAKWMNLIVSLKACGLDFDCDYRTNGYVEAVYVGIEIAKANKKSIVEAEEKLKVLYTPALQQMIASMFSQPENDESEVFESRHDYWD